jgi:predicted nuclease of predicted toxin-antitoxin system
MSPVMKFLIDVGVGKGVEEYLRGKDFDVKAVREIDPRMEDERIILEAFQEKRIVVTMDKDFGELVYQSSMRHSGILLLRMEDASGPEKVSVVRNIVENFQEHIADSFCVFQNNRLRIRKQIVP